MGKKWFPFKKTRKPKKDRVFDDVLMMGWMMGCDDGLVDEW